MQYKSKPQNQLYSSAIIVRCLHVPVQWYNTSFNLVEQSCQKWKGTVIKSGILALEFSVFVFASGIRPVRLEHVSMPTQG